MAQGKGRVKAAITAATSSVNAAKSLQTVKGAREQRCETSSQFTLNVERDLAWSEQALYLHSRALVRQRAPSGGEVT